MPTDNNNNKNKYCKLHSYYITISMEGYGLWKITRSPKVPNNEIQGAQHLSVYEKSKFSGTPELLEHSTAMRKHTILQTMHLDLYYTISKGKQTPHSYKNIMSQKWSPPPPPPLSDMGYSPTMRRRRLGIIDRGFFFH